jgi:hypothetical protein
MKFKRGSCSLLVPITALMAVSGCGGTDGTLPYATTFATIRDTVVASTVGEVPDSLVRRLVVDWRIQTDTASDIIGDIQNLAVAADEKVWVWDNTTPALWLIDPDGSAMRRIGRVGSGPGEYRSVNDIAVARDGALVMWDEGNARLNIYNTDGTHRTTVAMPFADCCGLPVTIDTANRIWLTTQPGVIAGQENPVDPSTFIATAIRYLRYDMTGALIDSVMAPVLPGADGRVAALQISSAGMLGAVRQVPYATYPRQAVSPLGHIVSAMARPYAVHTQARAKPIRITRAFVPPLVDGTERAQLRAEIEHFMRRENPDFRWNGPELPHDKPPINGLRVGLDGRIWVELSVPSEEFVPDLPSGPTRNRPPLVTFRPREKRWDVFEADGRYLGRIAASRGVTLYATRGNRLWGVIRDANDVAAVVRMHVDPGLQAHER